MYRKYVADLINQKHYRYGQILKKNQSIVDEIELYTLKFSNASFSEKVFIYVNKLQDRPICEQCKIGYCGFLNYFSGYRKCCSHACACKIIPIRRKKKDPNTYQKARSKQTRMMRSVLNEFGETLSEARVRKFKKSIDIPNSDNITPKQKISNGIRKHWSENAKPLKGKTYEEFYGSDKATKIKQKIGIATSKGLSKIAENGCSISENANRKRVATMRANIDKNGEDAITRAVKKGGKKTAKKMRELFNNLKHDNIDKKCSLYIFHCPARKIIKIGWSSDVEKRKITISKSLKSHIDTIKLIHNKYQYIRKLENILHERLDRFNIIQENKIIGRTEWFDENCLNDCLPIIQEFNHNIKLKGK